MQNFYKTLKENQLKLERKSIKTLQINIGRRCNQACFHCHVESGPTRTENMTRKIIDRILKLLQASKTVKTIDITGGAPEMNPHFSYFVKNLKTLGMNIIDRCNLTILQEKGYEHMPSLLCDYQVQIVASLPCYLKDNVESQRGKGVFDKSISSLQILNKLGYGKDQKLILNLVYNPVDASLPSNQQELEVAYKKYLKKKFNIVFNRLFTITNMPIKRYLYFLKRSKRLESYMQLLFDNFNPNIANNIMCTNLISVSWDGLLYDCDFNQMLEIPLKSTNKTIWDINSFDRFNQNIAFADHCYGCTAGSGSSCTGSLIKN